MIMKKDGQEIIILSSEGTNIKPYDGLFNEYIRAATSDHTRKAYRSDIHHYEKWGGRLPATPEMILNYLQDYAAHLNPRTLSRRLIALRHWHQYQNFPDPTRNALIQKTLVGIARIHGKPKEKARPITLDEITAISSSLITSPALVSIRDRALILVGYFGALRRSELVNIDVEHLTWQAEGVEIMIPSSKTDQQHEGQYCAIPYGNQVICPVEALKMWLEQSGIKHGPIFRSISSNETLSLQALTPLSVNHILKRCAAATGIKNANEFSSHSLRRGLATSAARAGAPLQAIMRAGRWKQTNTVMEYIDASERFNESAAANVMSTLEQKKKS